MALAIFDLDNTLIAGDSDHLWGEFLIAHGIVDDGDFKRTNDQFYHDYVQGRLDIYAYQRFVLKVLADHPVEQLAVWRHQFMQESIAPIMLTKAKALLTEHRSRGDFLLIITATNDFVTSPIAEQLGVDHLIATTAEIKHGRYTGDVSGTPCYREGKVLRLHEWLKESGHSLQGSAFYSDSHNDIPLLEVVAHATAVDPDPVLEREALERGWPILSLRG
ncbi:MAG: HAD-IB family hydrolase [Alcanivoracaceae bacterium]|nr:HAD-IB family hydrolase [Alcanivoracaceae bacterium]